MTKRRKIRLALAGGLILGVVLLAAFPLEPQPEPSYKGKSLSEWIIQRQSMSCIYALHPDNVAADEAIKHIGTNAIPYLLNWMHYKEPPKWQTRIYDLYSSVTKHEPPFARRYTLAMGSYSSLVGLGTNAMPALVTCLHDSDRDIRLFSVFILSAYGDKAHSAIPGLLEALRDRDSNVREHASITLQAIAPEALKRATGGVSP